MLEHAYNHVSNQLANTDAATGRIVNVTYASETAEASRAQMLSQASTSMFKETSSLAKLTLSLISTYVYRQISLSFCQTGGASNLFRI